MKLGSFTVIFITMLLFMEFMGLPTGLSLTLNTLGISINPATSELVSADLENSDFYSWIFGVGIGVLIVLSGAGAVIVGLFAKSYDTSLIILPFIILVAGLFTSTTWGLIKYVQDFPGAGPWMTAVVAMIMVPLGVAFIWSCVDYFAGR
jgi:hypothetical protein